MYKTILKAGIVFCIFSVLLGAFAAHGLKKILSTNSIITFETGVRYQFYHAFALIIAALLFKQINAQKIKWAAIFFTAGIFLFSGSLYLLALMPQYPFIGAITPLGGISFIVGWIMLLLAVNSIQ